MKQSCLLAGWLGLALVTGLAVASSRELHEGRVYAVAALISTGQSTRAPVYPVAAVKAALVRRPAAWVGRTVKVRGMVLSSGCLSWDAGGGTQCPDRRAYLLDRDGASLLPVAGWEPDQLLAALRRLPLAGGLVPGPQVARWGALATYRVRLLVAPPRCAMPRPATGCCCWTPRPALSGSREMARSPALLVLQALIQAACCKSGHTRLTHTYIHSSVFPVLPLQRRRTA